MQLIAYIRVSTDRQGQSGLGLEAQQASIAAYAASAGGHVVATYREIESGRRADRPELTKAIAHTRRARGVLVIARLDRLARNVHFLSGLMESGVEFRACDMPSAGRLTLHIMSAVAEEEARLISERTKAALAAATARGTLLGSARPGHWHGREDARRRGAIAGGQAMKARATADPAAARLARDLRDAGQSLAAIAAALTSAGHVTPRGRTWHPSQVQRLLAHA